MRLLPPAPLSRSELATLRAVGPCRNTKPLSSIVDLQRHFVVALGGRCEPRSRLNGLPLPLHQVAMLELHLHLLRLLLMSSARACGLLRDPPQQVLVSSAVTSFLTSLAAVTTVPRLSQFSTTGSLVQVVSSPQCSTSSSIHSSPSSIVAAIFRS
ncbi:hypothetical protein F2Q68_00044242 [Brassica cretica]|uniref:Uncharacterized protein n=1 Tax=Brassica cretica TaxID=69181 RepID=A0A8S9LJY9_BRACR|nr:hypothetical protein F2Q68_00044242 [Brassica cretica]